MGVLRWTPDEFWKSFPSDLYMAMDGHILANKPSDPNALDAEEIQGLKDLMERLGD